MKPAPGAGYSTDPVSGQLLEYGRKTYRPPRNLADHVIARDKTCVFPHLPTPRPTLRLGSSRRLVHRRRDMRTQLHPLCERHHYARHNAGWTVERTHDGAYHWTDPTNHTYTSTTRRQLIQSSCGLVGGRAGLPRSEASLMSAGLVEASSQARVFGGPVR